MLARIRSTSSGANAGFIATSVNMRHETSKFSLVQPIEIAL